MKKILKFDNIFELYEAMFDQLGEEESVFLVSNFDTVWDIAQFFMGAEFKIQYAEVDAYEYDKEYLLYVQWYDGLKTLSVEKVFNEEQGKYYGVCGVGFVDGKVDAQFLEDSLTNEATKNDYTPILFKFAGDDECPCTSKDIVVETSDDGYVIYKVPEELECLTSSLDHVIEDFQAALQLGS